MDDRVLVYRGADQPDMSVINPESDVWQHVKVIHKKLIEVLHVLLTRVDTPRIPCF